MTDVFVTNNSNDAINSTMGNTGGTNVVLMRGGQVSGSNTGINVISPSGTNASSLMITEADIFNNTAAAFIANGALASIFASNNTITGNGQVTVFAAGGVIQSFGDNRTIANGAAAAFILPNQAQESSSLAEPAALRPGNMMNDSAARSSGSGRRFFRGRSTPIELAPR